MITISTTIKAALSEVWEKWTKPEHIMQWNNASPDWHTPRAENDVRPGGNFTSRMEAKDGSVGFDFGGTYDDVQTEKSIVYTMGDGRKVTVTFTATEESVQVIETFDPESINPLEVQQQGWQAILDNFKKYVES